MRQNVSTRTQAGVALLEALISILVFSLGILALVGLQSIMVSTSIDAKYRADAALLANQIVGAMWASDRTSLDNFELNAADNVAPCSAGNNTATDENRSWLVQVEEILPGASAVKQQIIVGVNNLVTVTVCWKNVQDAGDARLQNAPPHRFVLSAQMP